jgi:chromosome segregation ATPase
MSLTDEIYSQLWEGLEKGLDWPQFLAKHSNSKGPLYSAVARFFSDVGTKIAAMKQEESSVQSKLDQSELALDSLRQKIKEGENNIGSLEDRQNALNEQIATLETKLAEKSELIKEVRDLEKLSFNVDALRQLKEVLTEIGAKHGLKGKDAASKFFAELKDYDAKAGFEQEIRRLETIASTKKLEAEKWQAEADSASRRYRDLSEAIAALQNLIKHDVKTEEVISWNEIVSKLGGPGELEDKLAQYKSMSELLTDQKREIEGGDKEIRRLSAQIKALNEQKIEIEAGIKSLSTSGVKKITEVSHKVMTGLDSLSTSGLKELTTVSDKAIAEIKSLLAEINIETVNLAQLNAKAGKLEKELTYARYFTTGDDSVLKSFPKEVIIAFLERASVYCKLNQLNPMVRAPDGFSRKYPTIYSSTEVALIDLLRWAEAGLAGASQ